jgi:hypothetical protein
MQHPSPNLQELADLARQGDASAMSKLRRALEPSMVHVVRRFMRAGPRPTAAARRIHAAANALGHRPGAPPAADHQALVDQVARCICDSVCDGLRARPGQDHRMRETVRG